MRYFRSFGLGVEIREDLISRFFGMVYCYGLMVIFIHIHVHILIGTVQFS